MDCRRRRPWATLVVALGLVIVLAGCSAPATPDSDGNPGVGNASVEEPDEAPGATTGPIDNTGLPVDENRVYNLTSDLLESNATPPRIEVDDLTTRFGPPEEPFFDLLGLTNDTEGAGGAGAAAVARGADTVVLTEALVADDRPYGAQRLELVLAHEFAHTIQFEERWYRFGWAEGATADQSTTEYRLLSRAMIEGGAVFTAEEYARATDGGVSQVGRFDQRYREASPDRRFAYAPYHHGGEYFDAVLDSAAELEAAYLSEPPTTTAEVLFPDAAGERAPVEFTAGTNRAGWQRRPNLDDTAGAMLIHVAVSAYTDVETADEATAGWANDRLFAFENDGAVSYAWATHWESPADADQFATAFEATLAARTDEQADRVGLRSAGDRTVIVLAGDQRFRESVAIDGEGANLDIVLPAADRPARPDLGQPALRVSVGS